MANNKTIPKTIIVAKPSGNDHIDRELILSALEVANKGDTIQFSSGVYHISKKIQIDIDEIILRGIPNETVIRGCNQKILPNTYTGYLIVVDLS